MHWNEEVGRDSAIEEKQGGEAINALRGGLLSLLKHWKKIEILHPLEFYTYILQSIEKNTCYKMNAEIKTNVLSKLREDKERIIESFRAKTIVEYENYVIKPKDGDIFANPIAEAHINTCTHELHKNVCSVVTNTPCDVENVQTMEELINCVKFSLIIAYDDCNRAVEQWVNGVNAYKEHFTSFGVHLRAFYDGLRMIFDEAKNDMTTFIRAQFIENKPDENKHVEMVHDFFASFKPNVENANFECGLRGINEKLNGYNENRHANVDTFDVNMFASHPNFNNIVKAYAEHNVIIEVIATSTVGQQIKISYADGKFKVTLRQSTA